MFGLDITVAHTERNLLPSPMLQSYSMYGPIVKQDSHNSQINDECRQTQPAKVLTVL